MATIIGDAGDNVLTGTSGADDMSGLAGNDVIDGGDGADVIRGNEGDDVLNGGDGDDLLAPYSGNDTLNGGAGQDRYYGYTVRTPSGGEAYIVASLLTGIAYKYDATTHILVGTDTMTSIEQLVGSNSALAHDHLIGDAGDNRLEGWGGDDRLEGGDGNDTLYGDGRNIDPLLDIALVGNDILSGGNGDDLLVASLGDDTLDGGAGRDRYYGFPAGRSLAEVVTFHIDLASGIAQKFVAGVAAGVDQLTSIEGATGSEGDDVILGDGGDNRLEGAGGGDELWGGAGADTLVGDNTTYNLALGPSATGDDVLHGEAGDDVLYASFGDDLADGGDGADRFYAYQAAPIANQAAWLDIDLSLGRALIYSGGVLVGTTILQAVENATGSNLGDDSLVGDGGANSLAGAGGNDLLRGGDGNDTLTGDEVVFNPAAPAGLVGNDQLYGEGGNDVLQMSYGTDTLDGGAGTDELYAYLPGPRDTTVAKVVVDLGAGTAKVYEAGVLMGTSTLVSIENVTGSNLGGDTLTGDGGVNRLVGYGGNDILDGGGGADVLVGGLGDDVYYVDNAGDLVVETAGQGTDIVHALVSWTLSAEVERLVLEGGANLNGTGNAAGNQLYGNTGANILDGGAGDDLLKGQDGDDVLIGGTGQDILVGGLGADTFRTTQASVYSSAAPAGRSLEADTVNDLIAGQGDRLDLSAIDADASTGADDAFHLATTFTGHAGELVLTYDAGLGKTMLQIDCDGDGSADYRMWIAGDVTGDSGGWLL